MAGCTIAIVHYEISYASYNILAKVRFASFLKLVFATQIRVSFMLKDLHVIMRYHDSGAMFTVNVIFSLTADLEEAPFQRPNINAAD